MAASKIRRSSALKSGVPLRRNARIRLSSFMVRAPKLKCLTVLSDSRPVCRKIRTIEEAPFSRSSQSRRNTCREESPFSPYGRAQRQQADDPDEAQQHDKPPPQRRIHPTIPVQREQYRTHQRPNH